jgi:hypothetical protein
MFADVVLNLFQHLAEVIARADEHRLVAISKVEIPRFTRNDTLFEIASHHASLVVAMTPHEGLAMTKGNAVLH